MHPFYLLRELLIRVFQHTLTVLLEGIDLLLQKLLRYMSTKQKLYWKWKSGSFIPTMPCCFFSFCIPFLLARISGQVLVYIMIAQKQTYTYTMTKLLVNNKCACNALHGEVNLCTKDSGWA